MLRFDKKQIVLHGPAGELPVRAEDDLTQKLAMLYEGFCQEGGVAKAARKFGYTRQRFYQLARLFHEQGAVGLLRKKTGPKAPYRRTDEVVRQVIRHFFLDRQASAQVVSQKLRQLGHPLSIRSVQRVVAEYGLQKKTLRRGGPPPRTDPGASHQAAPHPRAGRCAQPRTARASAPGR